MGEHRVTKRTGRGATYINKIESAIESLEDPVVRASFARAFGWVASGSEARRKELLLQLFSLVDSLPASIGPDETAAVLWKCARDNIPEKGEHNTAKGFATKMLAQLINELSSQSFSSEDPYITWLRENDAALGEDGQMRRLLIGRLLLSPLGPAACRMVKTTDPAKSKMVVFDTDSRLIQDLIISAICSGDSVSSCAVRSLGSLGSTFAESLGGVVPAALDDFGEEHLAKQMAFFEGRRRNLILLHRTYLLIARAQGPSGRLARDGITAAFLANNHFKPRYIDGFRAVMYSPLDSPPSWDKWLIFPNGTEDDFAEGKPDKGRRVDFTEIDPPLRDLAKKWFWEGDASLLLKIAHMEALGDFFAWRRSDVNITSFSEPYLILSEELELYLSSKRLKHSKRSFSAVKQCMMSFVEFLFEEGDDLADPLCPYTIESFGEGSGGKERKKAIMPAEHYRKIEKTLEQRSGDSLEDLLEYTAFLLLGTTPLRISSVLDLKCSQITETSRKGLYAVRQPSKTTGRDARGIQLLPETKRAIERAVQGTQGLRDAAPEEMRDYVFLIPGFMESVTVLAKTTFLGRFQRLCSELELPAYRPAAVRSGYMTAIDAAADELGMGQAAKNAGSDHVDPRTSPEHYIQHSDREYYETMHGIEIGTAKIRGRLSAGAPECASEDSAVEHGAGWCTCGSCLKAIASCLICPSFCTCPSQIPAFKANIERADTLMSELETDHDRGHLAAFKSLNVAYLCALEGLKKEIEGDAS